MQDNLPYQQWFYSCPKCKAHLTESYLSPRLSKKLSKVSDNKIFDHDCCKEGIEITGPIWTADINDTRFIDECLIALNQRLNTYEDKVVPDDIEFGEGKLINGILQSIKNEDIVGHQFNYVWKLDKHSSALKVTSIPHRQILYGCVY